MVFTDEHNTLLFIFILYQSRVIHHVPTVAVSTKQNAMTIGSIPAALSFLPEGERRLISRTAAGNRANLENWHVVLSFLGSI